MMDEQQFDTTRDTTHGTTSGQPDDALTTQDIVSAGQRAHTAPEGAQEGAQEGRQEGRLRRDRASGEDGRSVDTSTGTSMDAAPTRAAGRDDRGGAMAPTPLLSSEMTGAYQARWDAIQTAFVDEPRRVVEQADGLVAEMMQRLAETFARERANLERHWDQGGDVSTEDLRLALQRYRSFFQRLLST